LLPSLQYRKLGPVTCTTKTQRDNARKLLAAIDWYRERLGYEVRNTCPPEEPI